MPRLEWDKTGERLFETGVDRGVLYPAMSGAYPKGVAWNGITAVNEAPSGAEPTALYADNIKYLTLLSAEEYKYTIEAYMYPDEFAACDGSVSISEGVVINQQKRHPFGLSYRTLIGNDADGQEHGYKLHLIYGGLASPSQKDHKTVNDNPDASTMSWKVDCTPVNVPGYKPTASIEIDSTKIPAEKLTKLENILYGGDYTALTQQPADWTTNYKNYFEKTGENYVPVSGSSAPTWSSGKYYSGNDARLPLPEELITILSA